MTKVRVANFILTVFSVLIATSLLGLLIYGFITEPQGTAWFVGGVSTLALFFWALHTAIVNDWENGR